MASLARTELFDRRMRVIAALWLAVLSSLVYVTSEPEWFAPWPVPIVFLALLGIPPPVLVPSCYWLATTFAPSQERATKLLVIATFATAGLNLAWVMTNWSSGAQYQGRDHVIATAIGSGAGMVVVMILVIAAFFTKSRAVLFWSGVAFASWLSWGFIPYWGELP